MGNDHEHCFSASFVGKMTDQHEHAVHELREQNRRLKAELAAFVEVGAWCTPHDHDHELCGDNTRNCEVVPMYRRQESDNQ